MIGGRIALRFAAAASIAAAAAVSVVAASFALYAALKPLIGEAGGAAAVAVVFALGAWIGAALLNRRVETKPRRQEEHASPVEALTDRMGDLVRERPLMAAAAALAGGFIIVRNPALATIVAAALGGRQSGR